MLADAGKPLSTATLETYVELNRTRLETMLKVLDVDGAVRRVQGGWEGTGQEWAYDEARYARVAEARAIEQQAMLDYIATDGCRMLFLRDQLDDPGAEKCGRCDNCGGLAVTSTVSDQALSEAHEALSRPGVAISPRKMWPTALANLGIDLKGKIAEGAEEGRAIARLTDLGFGQQLRALFRPDAGEGPVPVPLAKAMIDVLGDWEPSAEAIVYVESATRPTLTRDFAEGLSRFLGIPVVGRFAIRDFDVRPGQGAANSAQRVAAIRRRFVLEGEIPAGRVILVDDLVVTGWTLTLAATAIREAGATGVLPVTLATET